MDKNQGFLDKYAPSLVSAVLLGLILWAGTALVESKTTLGEVKLQLQYLNDNLNRNYNDLDKRISGVESRLTVVEKYTYVNPPPQQPNLTLINK